MEKSSNKIFGCLNVIDFFGIKFKHYTTKTLDSIKVSQKGVTDTPRTKKIIVSLTSFNERIPTLHICLSSLLKQTLKPDMLILWLAKEQFPNLEKDLPNEILDLKNFGLTIRWCNDTKSYKKLIPALKEFPNDIIVTSDDDCYYDKRWLERLYNAYLENPDNIYCHRITKIILKNNKFKGKCEQNYKNPSFANKLSGGGGVLYPPHSLYEDITNEALFKELAPTNDDIWFWMMAVLNNRKVSIVKKPLKYPVARAHIKDLQILPIIRALLSQNSNALRRYK